MIGHAEYVWMGDSLPAVLSGFRPAVYLHLDELGLSGLGMPTFDVEIDGCVSNLLDEMKALRDLYDSGLSEAEVDELYEFCQQLNAD